MIDARIVLAASAAKYLVGEGEVTSSLVSVTVSKACRCQTRKRAVGSARSPATTIRPARVRAAMTSAVRATGASSTASTLAKEWFTTGRTRTAR
jgi:hypothetical protein